MEELQEGVEITEVNSNNNGIQLPEENSTQTNVDDNTSKTDNVDDKGTQIYNKERRLRKEAERKNRELEARIKALEEANKKPEKSTLDELVESGIDEDIAKSIASAIDKKQAGTKKTEQEVQDLKFQLQLEKTSKEPGFEDIVDYTDEIKDLTNKGLTVKQSYYALTGGQSSNTNREIARKLETKLENKQARQEILGGLNKPGTTVTASKPKIQATAEEVAIAKAAGMSIDEYKAVQALDNVKDYTEYEKSKK